MSIKKKTNNQIGKGRRKKLQELKSTQYDSPIKAIAEGVILTKDGRYVKLLEFSPINFLLRSSHEQEAITTSFAAALRTMPVKVQFKVVTDQADVSFHIAALNKAMQSETNRNCKRVMQDQIDLILQMGARDGVCRRFFVIFEYEAKEGDLAPTFDEIRMRLQNAENTIAAMLRDCGNEVLSSQSSEYLLQTLYHLMAKGLSKALPLKTRSEQEGIPLPSENSKEPYLYVNDLICPLCIDDSVSSKYLVIDGIYYSFLYVPSDAYANHAAAGWLSMFINFAEGVDVDFFILKQPQEKIRKALMLAMRIATAKLKETDDSNLDASERQSRLSSDYYIRDALANGEDFYEMATLITVSAKSKEELLAKTNALKERCLSNGIHIRLLNYEQQAARKMALPLCQVSKSIFKKARRNILTQSLASSYPFISFEFSDPNGVLVGRNQSNNSLIFLDLFDRRKYKNGNMAILGTSGSGKTYTLQCLALRMRQQQKRVFIIAPDKGHEFKRSCSAIGGQYIAINAGSTTNINVMEIRKTESAATLLLDGNDDSSILANKIQQLHTFFSMLTDLSNEEKQVLDEALMKTYALFGITTDNASLIDPVLGTYRKMPILGDLYQVLQKEGEAARRLCHVLSRFVSGSAKSFNQQTNVDLSNKYCVIDITQLSDELRPIGMFIALDMLWDLIKADRTEDKVLFLDELWVLIGASSSPEAAKFVLRLWKTCRAYSASAVCATQDIGDFFALEDGLYGKSIINNSAIKFFMYMEEDEAETVQNKLKLSDAEMMQITRFHKGEGLLAVNTNHVLASVETSSAEHFIMTTDAEDQRKIVKENIPCFTNTL